MISERLRKSQDIVRGKFYPQFTWVENDSCPWHDLAGPMSESKLAYITSCGLYRSDTQLPFNAENHLGDPSFRELHIDSPVDRIRIAHSHFSHEHAEADMEVVYPLKHLQRLEAENVIGELYPWIYSCMGFLPEPRQFMAETVPVLTRRLKDDGVCAVILTPC